MRIQVPRNSRIHRLGEARPEGGGDLGHGVRPDAGLVVDHLFIPIVFLQELEELNDV